jgi:hypothetical protein
MRRKEGRSTEITFIVTAVVVFLLIGFMPHQRSFGAAARRHLRAVQRGYWRPVPEDKQCVQVPAELAIPVRHMARALERHHALNQLSGAHHHHLARAAVASRVAVGERSFAQTMAWNKQANLAKHCSSVAAVALPLNPLACRVRLLEESLEEWKSSWAISNELNEVSMVDAIHLKSVIVDLEKRVAELSMPAVLALETPVEDVSPWLAFPSLDDGLVGLPPLWSPWSSGSQDFSWSQLSQHFTDFKIHEAEQRLTTLVMTVESLAASVRLHVEASCGKRIAPLAGEECLAGGGRFAANDKKVADFVDGVLAEVQVLGTSVLAQTTASNAELAEGMSALVVGLVTKLQGEMHDGFERSEARLAEEIAVLSEEQGGRCGSDSLTAAVGHSKQIGFVVMLYQLFAVAVERLLFVFQFIGQFFAFAVYRCSLILLHVFNIFAVVVEDLSNDPVFKLFAGVVEFLSMQDIYNDYFQEVLPDLVLVPGPGLTSASASTCVVTGPSPVPSADISHGASGSAARNASSPHARQ